MSNRALPKPSSDASDGGKNNGTMSAPGARAASATGGAACGAGVGWAVWRLAVSRLAESRRARGKGRDALLGRGRRPRGPGEPDPRGDDREREHRARHEGARAARPRRPAGRSSPAGAPLVTGHPATTILGRARLVSRRRAARVRVSPNRRRVRSAGGPCRFPAFACADQRPPAA